MQENTNESPESHKSDDALPNVVPQASSPQPNVVGQVQTPASFMPVQSTAPTVNTETPSQFIGGTIQIDPVAIAEEDETKGGDMLLFVTVFTVSLALILGIVANIAGLLEIAFNHIGSDKSSSAGSYFGLDSYELKTMLWLVSSLIISTIVYVLAVLFIQKKQQTKLNDFSTKVYGFVYGGFLTILGLATISSFSNFVYSCLVPLVPKGAYDSDGGPAWVGIVQALLTTVILGLVLFYYVKKAKASDRLS